MVGNISLYDVTGERLHTIYIGEAPECKTLVTQRLCGSGMRWKDKGAKVILSLRALVQSKGRWQQFWDKIDQYGSHVYA